MVALNSMQAAQDKANIAMWKKKYSEISSIYNIVKNEMSSSICVKTKEGDCNIPVECRQINTSGTYTTLSPEFVKRFLSHLQVIEGCSTKYSTSAYDSGDTRKCNNYHRKWSGLCENYSLYGNLIMPSPGSMVSPASCRTTSGASTHLNSWDLMNYSALLADGSVLYFGGHATGFISVDVNGFGKGPNVLGKDLFVAMVNDEWIRPLGAEDTYVKIDNKECECSKNYGDSGAQGYLGSGDLLHGRMISGGCCSAVYLKEK